MKADRRNGGGRRRAELEPPGRELSVLEGNGGVGPRGTSAGVAPPRTGEPAHCTDCLSAHCARPASHVRQYVGPVFCPGLARISVSVECQVTIG